MGSLKSPCTTSYRLSIDTIALNCVVFFWENRVFAIWRQTNRQTNEQMDNTDAWSRSRCRERRLNKVIKHCFKGERHVAWHLSIHLLSAFLLNTAILVGDAFTFCSIIYVYTDLICMSLV